MHGERRAEALRRLLSPAMRAGTERAGGGAEPVVNAEQTKERERERKKSPSRASEFVRRDEKLLTQVDLKLGPDSESGRGRFFDDEAETVWSNILYSQRLHCNLCQVKQ